MLLIVSLTINALVMFSNFNLHRSVNHIALLYQQDKRFDELKDNYNKLLAHLLYLKGKDALKFNRIEDAERFFKESIEANPKVTLSHFELATIAVKNNEINKALEYCQMESENNPGFIDNLNLLGTLYYLNEEFNEARQVLEKVVLLVPNNRDAVNNLTETYRQLNFPSKALTLISKYQESYDPENRDFLLEFKKRMSYLQEGDLENAVAGLPLTGSDEKLTTLALTILAAYNYVQKDLELSKNRIQLAKSKDEKNLLPTLIRDKVFENYPFESFSENNSAK